MKFSKTNNRSGYLGFRHPHLWHDRCEPRSRMIYLPWAVFSWLPVSVCTRVPRLRSGRAICKKRFSPRNTCPCTRMFQQTPVVSFRKKKKNVLCGTEENWIPMFEHSTYARQVRSTQSTPVTCTTFCLGNVDAIINAQVSFRTDNITVILGKRNH